MTRRRRPKRADARLLSALASGISVAEAARATGLSQRTVYRRLADPAFRKQLSGLRDELVTDALAGLARSAAKAVETLRRLLEARNEHVQLGAARALLDQLLRLREGVELAERVAALERRSEQDRRRPR
jgi:DNA-binding transcriptional ArsR family regulator